MISCFCWVALDHIDIHTGSWRPIRFFAVYFCASEKGHAYKHPVSQKACIWMRFPFGEDEEFASLFESFFRYIKHDWMLKKLICTQASKQIGVFGSHLREGMSSKKHLVGGTAGYLVKKLNTKLPSVQHQRSLSLRQVIKNTNHGLVIRRRHVPCLHSKKGKTSGLLGVWWKNTS